jgi:hypothetical protein
VTDEEVARIAGLLSQRNAIDDAIAAVIHWPMAAGHLGEWIAAQVFDIELEQSAATARSTAGSVPAPCRAAP